MADLVILLTTLLRLLPYFTYDGDFSSCRICFGYLRFVFYNKKAVVLNEIINARKRKFTARHLWHQCERGILFSFEHRPTNIYCFIQEHVKYPSAQTIYLFLF